MADLLTQGARLVQTIRQDHLTGPVTYERGGQSVTLQATVGKTVFRLDNGYGAAIRYVSRDYLVRSEDLASLVDPEDPDGPAEPRRGDQVRQRVNGRERVYEVLAPGDEPEWRCSDPRGLTWRIHTQEVS